MEHCQMATKCFWLPMGYVDSRQPKTFGHHSSSLKATENFWSPFLKFESDQKVLVTNWPIVPFVTKDNQN